jgi:hypothetical protein
MGLEMIEEAWVYELRLGSKLRTLLWMLESACLFLDYCCFRKPLQPPGAYEEIYLLQRAF